MKNSETNGGSGAASVPEDALQALDDDIEATGGGYEAPEDFADSVARTMFDTTSSADGTVTIVMPHENIEPLPRQSLVRIKSRDGRRYLGAVVRGPFAEPDGLKGDAPILVAVNVRGGLLLPKYHGRAQVELIAEELDDGTLVPPRRRPVPNSPASLLDAEETARVLRLQGDVELGVVEGHEAVRLAVPSTSKNVFPRHVGVLGTTGGGKSTTVSGVVDSLQRAGMAVVFIDTEGEYTAIDQPADDERMIQALKRQGRSPSGVANTHVHVLVGREPSNAAHPRISEFSLQFSDLSPYAVVEILDLSEAQHERFLKAYDVTKLMLEKAGIYPKTAKERQEALEIDEFDEGFPKMKLNDLYDVVAQIAAIIADDTDPVLTNANFSAKRKELKTLIGAAKMPKSVPSWRALQGKLGRLKRYNVFDNPTASSLNFEELLQPGRVSILDLGDVDSPMINNLVIAQLLRGVHQRQDKAYKEAQAAKTDPVRTMIFIEEAHEFLSAERIRQMPVLFQQVARIARRGRKRWLGIAFITQLPQHLPDEVLGLINNWVLHKIGDANVVSRLRRSIAGIDESLWHLLPALAPGQAVVSFTSMQRPVLTSIDPTPAKLLMVE